MIFHKTYLTFVVLVLLSVEQWALAHDSRDLLLRGINTFNRAYNGWDEELFRSSLNTFMKASRAGSKDGLGEYWAGTVYFFLSLQNLFSGEIPADKERGIENAKKGIEILSRSIEISPDFSESYALRGVLRGILIKMKPSSIFTQGQKVGKDRKKALALEKNNPRVHYLTGVSFWHAPELLGGPDRALEHLLEAEKLFEKENMVTKDKVLPRWGRSTCLAFIGDIFLSRKEKSKAYIYYKKAVDVNPADPLALRGLGKLEQVE